MAETILIRTERSEDARAVRRLAALDSAPVPRSPLLLAEVDGSVRAALSLADGGAIADPFHPSGPLVRLLKVRAEQAHDRGRGRRLADRVRLWEQLWARARPGQLF